MRVWDGNNNKWIEVSSVELKQKDGTNTKTKKNKQTNKNYFDDGYQFGDVSKTIVQAGKNIVKTPENFKDGYQFGDVTKTALGTTADVGLGVVKGIANFGESIGDLINFGLAAGIKGVGKLTNNQRLQNFADTYREEAANDEVVNTFFGKLDKITDKTTAAGSTTDALSSGIGNVMAMANGGMLLPKGAQALKVGKFAMPTTAIVSGTGSGMAEAYRNDATDGQALAYGLMSGFGEAFSESLFGGLGTKFTKVYGVGGLDDAIIKKITDNISNRALRILSESGFKAIGEGTEEVISGFSSAIAKKLTYLDDQEFDKILRDEDLLNQFIIGTLTSVVSQTPGTIQSVSQGRDYITGKTSVDEAIDARNKLYNDFNSEINQNNQVLAPLSVKNNINQQNTSDTSNFAKNSIETQNIDGKEYAPFIPVNNSFKYEKSNNPKINALNESMAKYFDNSQATRDLSQVVNKIVEDKGYNVTFDDTIKNSKGQLINAQISSKNGEISIKINPNSPRAAEFLLMHEVTHAIETDSMKKLVMDYASKNTEFNQVLESLKQTYETDDVSDEVLADISGQLFGNQEFINNLSLEQPNVFKRIYNKIVELLNKLTGNSKEKLFIEDLKNKWETAYRNTTTESAIDNLSNATKFSVKSNSKIGQYWEVETEKDIFKNIKNRKELRNKAFEYILNGNSNFETIIDKIDGKDIQFRRISAQEYIYGTNSKKLSNQEYNKKMRLSTSIDDLINNANIKYYSPLQHDSKIFKSGFNNFQGILKIDDNYFRYIVRVGKAKNDNIFYDLSLENLSTEKGTDTRVPSTESTSLINKKSVPLTGNNISQSNNNVKSDTSSTKYSMQENENDTQELENSSFSYDNQGRTLTKEQQDYFKDSKARDENGNLRVLYHGTPNEFHKFSYEFLGTNGTLLGKGFYLTDDINVAQAYANKGENGKVMELYADIKKPLKWGETTISKQQFKDFVEVVNQATEGRLFADYSGEYSEKGSEQYNSTLNDILMDYEYGGDDIDLVSGILNTTGMSWDKGYKILKDTTGYDGIIVTTDVYDSGEGNVYIPFQSNQIKNVDNTNPTSDADIRYSKENKTWKEHLEENYKATGTRTDMKEIRNDVKKVGLEEQIENRVGKILEQANNDHDSMIEIFETYLEENNITNPTKEDIDNSIIDIMGYDNDLSSEETAEYEKKYYETINEYLKNRNVKYSKEEKTKKTLNPLEISKLIPEDANTTPKLKNVKVSTGDGKSSFVDNLLDKTDMLSFESKNTILKDSDVKYYEEVTNKESLEKAFKRLNDNGYFEVNNWRSKASETATSVDIAEGWILMKQYQDAIEKTDSVSEKEYLNRSMVQVARKLREMGTKAGQTVQAFNIMNRLTPEGMVYFAQSELEDAYNQMVKGKTKGWIDKYKSDFELSPSETKFIMDTMQEVMNMKDGYDKRVKLAQIQKLMTDKLPPERGAGMKAWMRMSMLFNPKTQVRNILGNAVIAPVNSISDFISGKVDKAVASVTGVRTTGSTNMKSYTKGFKTGIFQSYNDFRLGINTRNIEGNRFEISTGKSFKDQSKIGKKLNQIDSFLSFMLDAGDRGFYEAAFTNSINNQLVLNNTTKVTQDMIDIATTEALQRTWQDNNGYTRFVLGVRNGLNSMFNVKGYGLGDVLIPFAKTPANLTKAIVDYSPVGMIKAIVEGNNLKNAIKTGQFTPQQQHKFVQDLGKGVAGTLLYVLGYALAQAGITTGESDEDKDVANFMKNTLGINSYSIKIGNKSFTYDWAQPIAAPLAIMANYSEKQKANSDASAVENLVNSLDVAGNILLEQSFMESINTVLNNRNGIATGIQEAIVELPSRAIPTFLKQIVDLTDSTQRQSFVYDKPLESAINKVKAKIPGASYALAPTVDTMGREVKKYGGKNNIFNVLFNPANVNTENISKSAEEIYKLYKETGNGSIMPKVTPYYINSKGEKIVLTNEQRSEFQKVSGKLIEDEVKKLLNSDDYKSMSSEDKAKIIEDLVNYSYNKAKYEILDMEMSTAYQKAHKYELNGGNVSDYYTFTNSVDDTNSETKKASVLNYLVNSSLNDEEIAELYTKYYSNEETVSLIKTLGISMKEFIKLDSQNFESDYNSKGKAISGSKQKKLFNYINSLKLSSVQKAALMKTQYSSYKAADKQILNYINKQNISKYEKCVIAKQLGFDNYDNYIINYIMKLQALTQEEKLKKLEQLGFNVRNGRVYN